MSRLTVKQISATVVYDVLVPEDWSDEQILRFADEDQGGDNRDDGDGALDALRPGQMIQRSAQYQIIAS